MDIPPFAIWIVGLYGRLRVARGPRYALAFVAEWGLLTVLSGAVGETA